MSSSNTSDAESMAARCRIASHLMQSASAAQKSNALNAIHAALKIHRQAILDANLQDMEVARKEVLAGHLSSTLVKRLDLGAGGDKYESLLQGVLDVDKLDDPSGKVTLATHLDDGLDLYRARPEVVVQISCLSIKSGNAVILKGGKEASRSNTALYEVIRTALASLPEGEGIPVEAVQMVETREDIDTLLKLDRYIDLVIPRGSNQLVKYIQGNTRILFSAMQMDFAQSIWMLLASSEKAVRVVVDSKTTYPAACNSTETLLIHSSLLSTVFPDLVLALQATNVTPPAQDYDTEFLDLTIAVKVVGSVEEAVEHINAHGSHHTDSIVTEDEEAAEFFMRRVDAAGVYWNASTRFADGFRYGFGAEIGVSTNKTHARGPVGLEGLVIYKYRLYGKGHITSDYGSGKKSFLHAPIPIDATLEKKFQI
ncbi:putative gpantothenate kinase 4 [Chytridium lagenaria]|nr:putative gpantothenate kinase 4 [Chytridium lagenaria]